MRAPVHVSGVEVVGDHRLRLRFDDGTAGEIAFGDDDWGGVFAPLSDPAYFRRVEFDAVLGTITWPNGADIAPETLHAWAIRGRS